MEYEDFLGQEIKVGDTIVYAVRHGSFPKMKRGTVVSLVTSAEGWHSLRLHTDDSDRLIAFHTLTNCAVIKGYSGRNEKN